MKIVEGFLANQHSKFNPNFEKMWAILAVLFRRQTSRTVQIILLSTFLSHVGIFSPLFFLVRL